MADNITNEKFYSVIVRGIREGVFIKKILYYEKDGNFLIPKAQVGTNKSLDKIELTQDMKSKLLKHSIYVNSWS